MVVGSVLAALAVYFRDESYLLCAILIGWTAYLQRPRRLRAVAMAGTTMLLTSTTCMYSEFNDKMVFLTSTKEGFDQLVQTLGARGYDSALLVAQLPEAQAKGAKGLDSSRAACLNAKTRETAVALLAEGRIQ